MIFGRYTTCKRIDGDRHYPLVLVFNPVLINPPFGGVAKILLSLRCNSHPNHQFFNPKVPSNRLPAGKHSQKAPPIQIHQVFQVFTASFLLKISELMAKETGRHTWVSKHLAKGFAIQPSFLNHITARFFLRICSFGLSTDIASLSCSAWKIDARWFQPSWTNSVW